MSQLNLSKAKKVNEYERPKIIKENKDACNMTYSYKDELEQGQMIYRHFLKI